MVELPLPPPRLWSSPTVPFGKTNSEYFAFCNAHHLPDYTDLVIIELDSDDKPHVIFST